VNGDFLVFPSSLDLTRLTTRSMQEHPSIQRLARLIDQADHTIEFERQSRVPNVSLNTSYAREYGREGFDAGLSVPTPLWYQQQGEIAGSLGAKRKEEAELLRTRNELLRQINQYYQDAQTTAKLIEVLEKGLLKQAEEALRIAKFSFQQGAATMHRHALSCPWRCHGSNGRSAACCEAPTRPCMRSAVRIVGA
jgi:cobalt-zinc-cadmium efflux system outer membrane protein